jgi:hypothetical protein
MPAAGDTCEIAESARETPMTWWPQSAHRSPDYVSRLRSDA